MLTIRSTRVLPGPNIWAPVPVIVLEVAIGELEERLGRETPVFIDRLIALLPSLEAHRATVGRLELGFARLLLAPIALTLQQHASAGVAKTQDLATRAEFSYAQTHPAAEPGRYTVVYAYQHEDVGKATSRLAVRLLNHLLYGSEPGFAFAAELEALSRRHERHSADPFTATIMEAANRRGIPVLELSGSPPLVQLGTGAYQRRITGSVRAVTCGSATTIGGNMALTRRLLHGARLPAGNGMVVQNANGAVVAARRLGYPVVLTPFAGRHSPIGCRNLHNEADVHDAFPDAARDSLSGRLIVARPAAGTVYRILVVGDRMAAVAEQAPIHSTVQGQTGEADLGTLATSADQTTAVLSARDLTLDDGVAESRVIPLALTGSRGSGGTTIDRTDEIHPRTAAIACHAAQFVGLAVAEDATLLARLDAAFFQVAEAHGGLLVKVYDPTMLSREGLRRDGLDIERLEAGHRFRWCPEGDPGRGVAAVRQLLAEETPVGRSMWVVLDWLGEPELEVALRQQEQLADLVAAAPLVVATGVVEPEMADWPGADAQWRLLESLRGVIRYSRRGLLLSRVVAPPHL